MDLTYLEIKEDMQDSFDSLYKRANYTAKDAFYATLEDYITHDSSTETEECCIYVNFALILINAEEKIEFLKYRLLELIDDKNISLYKEELNNDFTNFYQDLITLKKLL
ncbi:hypothetical protein [Lacrimispora amygdalina]|uniref:hypothetical protein n=1 Tax=Lacrimispora amygdalina TaxID=253257 RepID=UPI000BE25767|nr:hypothetical protein [Lacrimispora amygdalina]